MNFLTTDDFNRELTSIQKKGECARMNAILWYAGQN